MKPFRRKNRAAGLLLALRTGMGAPDSSQWLLQLVWLLILPLPIACVAWTVTHEEIFREPREYCVEKSQNARSLFIRKFFYLFTCEYCFSHYVTIFFLILTGYRLLLDDWRGYLISFFAVVAVANAYISSFARLRQEVKSEKLEAQRKEKVLEKAEKAAEAENQSDAGSSSGSSTPASSSRISKARSASSS
ncbi:MAG TPA: hypothetical protein VE685_21110 [Thermoanaerobaculia bacterium]|nr:hypothetical protein [Thermoanaerobaculia bacterium]